MASAQIGEEVAAQRARARLTPEDESEWEYEYSTTETETFYVTLDLSTADFTAPHKNVISNTRTDYHGKPLTEAERVRHKYYDNGATGGGADEEDEDEQRTRQLNSQLNSSRQARESPDQDRAEADDGESFEKVQIMELHSPNPVISYKGRVYQGQWSQNVGTELLMTRHDDNDPLPAVRSLDDGVDLLAASCARITVTQKELERKDPESTQGHDKLTAEEREVLTKMIPKPETKPSIARTNQANFLARLIALKKRKGEKDEVPVLVNGHVRDLWVKGSHRGRGRGGRPKGSGRRRRGIDAFQQEGAPHHRSAPASIAESSNSLPTPRRWDDLGNANVGTHDGGGGGSSSAEENAMEVDEGSNESGFSDDEGSMGEENGQEDEDGSGSDGQSDDEDSDGDEMDVDES